VGGLNIELAGVNTFLCTPINRQSKNMLFTAGSITVRRVPRGSCAVTRYVRLAAKMAHSAYLYHFEFIMELTGAGYFQRRALVIAVGPSVLPP
jgi:hypothetical protein